MSGHIIGLDKLDAKLANLAREAGIAVVPAMQRAGQELVDVIRGELYADKGLSPAVQDALASTVGYSLKNTAVDRQIKVGIGVGTAGFRARRRRSNSRRSGKRSGVGLGGMNAHWMVLGTRDRKTKSGRRTGRITMTTTAVPRAMSTQAGPIIDAMLNDIAANVVAQF